MNITLMLLQEGCSAWHFDYCLHAAWTLAGSLVAIVTVIAGVVIIVLISVNFSLWRR